MTPEETIKLISKQWCTLDNLSKLMDCGRNKALKSKKEIRAKLLKEGYYIPGKNLPMQAVVDILKIDIDRLGRIVNLTKSK